MSPVLASPNKLSCWSVRTGHVGLPAFVIRCISFFVLVSFFVGQCLSQTSTVVEDCDRLSRVAFLGRPATETRRRRPAVGRGAHRARRRAVRVVFCLERFFFFLLVSCCFHRR